MDGYGVKDGFLTPLDRSDLPGAGEAASENMGSVSVAYIFHVKADGTFSRVNNLPELAEGEGMICFSEGLFVDPLEMSVDFLKSTTLEEWISYITVRQMTRLREISDQLFIYAERR